ncbi:hypothetical protein B0J11DRAFT_570317 [Dendryphion nanum]|uniref:Uncharacterized protein n=1 Tax=Dendryphion nanum TaxID=256645 RepID=A0A9P9DJ90_9PLEO|nr:hypothetical protein B0J11DRAFT_570317 [Dendryphion nanum]
MEPIPSNTGLIVFPAEKEVVQPTGIEIVREEKIAISQVHDTYIYNVEPSPERPKRFGPVFACRRTICIVVASLLTIITLAIILPMILLRNKNTNSISNSAVVPPPNITTASITHSITTISRTATTSSIPTPSTRSISNHSAIAPLSPLAAVSWPDPSSSQGAYNTRVVYQTQAGTLQASTCNSHTQQWEITPLVASEWKKGSPIALTSFPKDIYGRKQGEQIELFYTNNQGTHQPLSPSLQYPPPHSPIPDILQELTWSPSPPGGSPGSINTENYLNPSASPISSYWPFVFFQNNASELVETVYQFTHEWNSKGYKIALLDSGADISIVPGSHLLRTVCIFYRNGVGDVVEYVRGHGVLDFEIVDPPILRAFPSTSHFTTFALPSPDAPSNPSSSTPVPLSTILLYQSPDDSTIYTLYRSAAPISPPSKFTWSSPIKHSAFDGADKGTKITCVTGFSYLDKELRVGGGLGRCYFQVEGKLKEVEIVRKGEGDGGIDWKVIGWVGV